MEKNYDFREYEADKVESLHYDSRDGRLLAKFKGIGRVLEYNMNTEQWDYPAGDYDGYDRALYLGQGCWESFENLPKQWIKPIFENKWFGKYTSDGIFLKDGRTIDVSKYCEENCHG